MVAGDLNKKGIEESKFFKNIGLRPVLPYKQKTRGDQHLDKMRTNMEDTCVKLVKSTQYDHS